MCSFLGSLGFHISSLLTTHMSNREKVINKRQHLSLKKQNKLFLDFVLSREINMLCQLKVMDGLGSLVLTWL